MMKEINVNDFCAITGTATNTDAENLYNHIKDLTSDNTIVVLDFCDIKCVDLSFFKTLLPYYYPDTEHLKFSNLSADAMPLVKETFSCLIQGAL